MTLFTAARKKGPRSVIAASGGTLSPGTIDSMNPPDRLYGKADAARILAMSVRVLDRRVDAGEITAVRDERSVKFRESELLRYMDSLPSRLPRGSDAT